jgi:recombination protein RecT
MGELAKKQTPSTGVKSLSSFLNSDAIKNKFTEILGQKGVGFISSVLSVVNSSNQLKNADQNSIYTAALMAASLDLPINQNLGFAYIVPYNGKVGNDYIQMAQFQLGYKGFIQLAQRSGLYKKINSSDVREGEIIKHDRMTGEFEFNWIQDTNERLTKKVIGYLSFFELNNGFRNTFYMTIEEIEAHAKKYSQTYKKYNSGLWKDEFSAMAMKTVTKLNLSKNGPLSIEMQRAVVADQAVIKSDSFVNEPETLDIEPEFVDSPENATKEEKVANKKETVKAAKASASVNKSEGKNKEITTTDTTTDMYTLISECKTMEELSALAKEIPSEDFDLAIAVDDKKRELTSASKGELFDPNKLP